MRDPARRCYTGGVRRVPLACSLFVLLLATGCSGWKRFLYEGFGRDGWQQPARVIEALGVEPGQRVADLGAGGGYFTFPLAEAVGPDGVVYAVDVDPDMTAYLEERATEEGAGQVRVVLGEYADPLLPDGEIDLLFTCNTYHHIEERPDYFRRVRADLAPGGRVAILELSDVSWFPRTFGHHTPRDRIVAEMEEAGYALAREHDFLERQHFLVFTPAGE